MIRVFMVAFVCVLGLSAPVFAHCGKCGVGEAHEEAVTEESGNMCLCGMHVKAGEGVAVEYEGKTYYFCSQGCADQFNKDPKAAVEKICGVQAK